MIKQHFRKEVASTYVSFLFGADAWTWAQPTAQEGGGGNGGLAYLFMNHES